MADRVDARCHPNNGSIAYGQLRNTWLFPPWFAVVVVPGLTAQGGGLRGSSRSRTHGPTTVFLGQPGIGQLLRCLESTVVGADGVGGRHRLADCSA